MKKFVALSIILILALSIVGCKGKDSGNSTIYGNTAANIQNRGIATIQEDRIYYSFIGSYEGNRLYSIKTDGNDKKFITDGKG